MKLNVIGCDQSLTYTALHHAHKLVDGRPVSNAASIKSRPEAFGRHPIARLHYLQHEFDFQLLRSAVLVCGPRVQPTEHGGVLVVEGYSFGSKNSADELRELGGAIRLAAYQRGYHVIVVPPSTLKKYVADNGHESKDGMRMHVLRRWNYVSTDDNDADAYALMRLGVDWLNWASCRAGLPYGPLENGTNLTILSQLYPHPGKGCAPFPGFEAGPPRKPTRKEKEAERARKAEAKEAEREAKRQAKEAAKVERERKKQEKAALAQGYRQVERKRKGKAA